MRRPGGAARYRQRIGDERLKAVAEHVRKWLFSEEKVAAKKTTVTKVASAKKGKQTVKAELPYILRALGIDPAPLPPLHSNRAPRVRVVRPLHSAPRPSLRAAA